MIEKNHGIKNELWSRASNIWALTRGMGWTLDSERATKMIEEHLQEAVAAAIRENDVLKHEISTQKEMIRSLKKSIVVRNDALRSLDVDPDKL